MSPWLLVPGAVVLFFGFVVFFGAPYLPTLTPQVRAAFDLLRLRPGDTLLELGCGDGKVLLAAAERGCRAVGIELNPLLAVIAWLRTRKYRGRVIVRCGNFWRMQWPESDAVYTFLLNRYMPELDKRMREQGGKLASVAFQVPGREPAAEQNGVFLYDYRKP